MGSFCLNFSFTKTLIMYRKIIETIDIIKVAIFVLEITLQISINCFYNSKNKIKNIISQL